MPIQGRKCEIIITTIKENKFDTSHNPFCLPTQQRYFEIQT